MAGLLDPDVLKALNLDPQSLQAVQSLVGALGPSDEDKAAARKQAFMLAGLGMIGARKGYLPQDMSRAAQAGVLSYNQDLKDLGQQRMQAIGQAATLYPLLQRSDTQKQLANIFTGSTLPPVPTTSVMGAGGPTPDNLAKVQAATPAQPNPADSYRKAAAVYAAQGNATAAKQMADIAAQFDNDFNTTPQLYRDEQGNIKRQLISKRGDVKDLPGLPAEKLHFADTGNLAGVGIDPYSGAPLTAGLPKLQTPDSKASNALGYAHLAETKRHNQLTEGDPVLIEQQAQSIASGKLPPITGYGLRSPVGMAVMGRVEQINPDYSAQDWQAQQKTLKEFTSGKPAQQVRSFNVALAHLDTLDKAATALKNNDAVLFNKASNYFAQQTGSPVPTNFNAVKVIVGNELVKAIVGSGGGVEDRDKAAKSIDAANSPAQLQGVISQYKELMKGQLGGLRQQYETGTKRKDFDQFLSPEARAVASGGQGSDIRARADAILRGQ